MSLCEMRSSRELGRYFSTLFAVDGGVRGDRTVAGGVRRGRVISASRNGIGRQRSRHRHRLGGTYKANTVGETPGIYVETHGSTRRHSTETHGSPPPPPPPPPDLPRKSVCLSVADWRRHFRCLSFPFVFGRGRLLWFVVHVHSTLVVEGHLVLVVCCFFAK